MRIILALISFSLVFAMTACGTKSEQLETRDSSASQSTLKTANEKPTTPADTVARLLELAEAGEWETYVDDHYGEVHKFRDEEDRAALVSRFREDWGVQVIEALRQVKSIEPRLTADGTEAVFELGDSRFTLYKDEEGHWKFHL